MRCVYRVAGLACRRARVEPGQTTLGHFVLRNDPLSIGSFEERFGSKRISHLRANPSLSLPIIIQQISKQRYERRTAYAERI